MQDDKAFADILQACLEATFEGRGSVEACVARHPEHAARLEELLLLSSRVRALPLPTPTPETLAAGERRLLQAARLRAPAGGCGSWLRSRWAWLACGAAAVLSGLCFLLCVLIVVIVIIKPWPPCPTSTPTSTWMPTTSTPFPPSPIRTPTPFPPSPTHTLSPFPPSPIRTPTPFPPSPTPTPAPFLPTPTPTATPIPSTPTPWPTNTPLPTNTPVPPTPTSARQPRPSLGFHPDELRAEGCETSYRATGSLKNHGGELANWAANVQIGHEIVKGAEYVAQVAVSPDFWPVIAGNETVNYTITVDTTAAWQGQKGKEIKVRFYIAREDNRPGHHQTQAHLTIVNRCP
jgi:hypothetical protein